MTRRISNPWLALALAVVVIDAVQIARHRPTLSASFRDAVRHPVKRWPVLVAWAALTSHLAVGRP